MANGGKIEPYWWHSLSAGCARFTPDTYLYKYLVARSFATQEFSGLN